MRPGEHPLAGGFATLKKQLLGKTLSPDEARQLAWLKLIADVIFRYEGCWKKVEDRFAGDLLNAAKCTAVLFEVEVVFFGLEPKVTSLEWPIYREGERDIKTFGPDLLVECKLIRTSNVSRVLAKVKDAKGQSGPPDIPFVVAVGFEQKMAATAVDGILAEMNRRRDWFESHPEVSAVLIFAPTSVDLSRTLAGPLAVPGREFRRGITTQVVNLAARNPLPSGFTFDWGR